MRSTHHAPAGGGPGAHRTNQRVMAGRTLALLGDSILDNAPYTGPEPDTATHLQRLLGPDWDVLLLARDGAVMRDVPHQLRRLRGRPDLAVLSIGGNDAIEHIGLLDRPAASSAEVLDELVGIVDAFARHYEEVARAVAERAHRTLLCTIYDVRLEPARYARLVRVPVALLDDVIIRTGARLGLDVLDVRSVCTDDADFVLQIEPSARGAAKIAAAIAAAARDGDGLATGRLFTG